jgi:hypothetical protein
MAAPHVAGLAARLQQAKPGITVSEISSTLTATKTGTGSVTIANFVEEEPAAPGDETTTTVPDETSSPTTVATTTTTTTTTTTVAPKPTKSKAPGRNKSVSQPKEFSLGYETREDITALVASWVDDASAETYEIACAPSRLGINATVTTKFMVERAAVAQVATGRSETVLTLSPSESQRCWITAMIGTDKSAQSNPAMLIVQAQRKDVPTTTQPPTPTTTVATERVAPTTPRAPAAPAAPSNPGQGKNPKK